MIDNHLFIERAIFKPGWKNGAKMNRKGQQKMSDFQRVYQDVAKARLGLHALINTLPFATDGVVLKYRDLLIDGYAALRKLELALIYNGDAND